MKKRSKRFQAAQKKVEHGKEYSITEAFRLLKETASAKFTETIDVAVNLGVDPKHADQAITADRLIFLSRRD